MSDSPRLQVTKMNERGDVIDQQDFDHLVGVFVYLQEAFPIDGRN